MVIADVSGKGIGGALMMAVCRSVIQAQAKNEYDPSSMLISLNDILSPNLAENMFICMLYMVLNTETHLLSYARAGHEPPIIFHRDTQKIDREENKQKHHILTNFCNVTFACKDDLKEGGGAQLCGRVPRHLVVERRGSSFPQHQGRSHHHRLHSLPLWSSRGSPPPSSSFSYWLFP